MGEEAECFDDERVDRPRGVSGGERGGCKGEVTKVGEGFDGSFVGVGDATCAEVLAETVRGDKCGLVGVVIEEVFEGGDVEVP